MKKIIGLCFILFSGLLLSQDIVFDPVSPSFDLNKNQVEKIVSITNRSDQTMICIPKITRMEKDQSPLFIGDYIYANPGRIQLEPNQSGAVKLYLYNTENLKDSGEYLARFSVDAKPLYKKKTKDLKLNFSVEGTLSVIKGKIIKNIQESKPTLIKNAKNININSHIINHSNVRAYVYYTITLYDKTNKVISKTDDVVVVYKQSKLDFEKTLALKSLNGVTHIQVQCYDKLFFEENKKIVYTDTVTL